MGPLAIAALGAAQAAATLAGNFLQAKGQSNTNAANAAQAQQQMDFQERMRATQYQTSVQDMIKAGLNPAMAHFSGGAGTPGGASAQMANPMGGVAQSANAAAQIAMNAAQLQQMRAQTLKTIAEAGATEQSRRQSELMFADNAALLSARNVNERLKGGELEARSRVAMDSIPLKLAIMRAELDLLRTNAREGQSRATLNELAQPGAFSKALHDRTMWGKYVMPYVNDATAASRALGAVRLQGGF